MSPAGISSDEAKRIVIAKTKQLWMLTVIRPYKILCAEFLYVAKGLRNLFTIQMKRSTRSSASLTIIRPTATSLIFSDRSLVYTAPRLLNDLQSEIRKINYSVNKSVTDSPLAITPESINFPKTN